MTTLCTITLTLLPLWFRVTCRGVLCETALPTTGGSNKRLLGFLCFKGPVSTRTASDIERIVRHVLVSIH
ncbi:hypothetical protein LSAT2_026118 [Lamellibrachia satsuma]|nr:hypothetical protein LSAT2_026118 [Lamellibrachia satsuma]